jgi:hypothetical protein
MAFKQRTSTQGGTTVCSKGPKRRSRVSTADPEKSQLRTQPEMKASAQTDEALRKSQATSPPRDKDVADIACLDVRK